MKNFVAYTLVLLLLASCSADQSPLYQDASAPIEKRVEDLLSRMTLEEKILQLNQYTVGRNDNINNIGEIAEKIPAEIGSLICFLESPEDRNKIQHYIVENSRLGIPCLFGFDVIHGFRTICPIPLAQAASWDPELALRGAQVAAREAYDVGIDWTFSPMVDVARDPRWGRVMEGYGEDTYLASRFSEATVRGYQGPSIESLSEPGTIAACLKHYVGYGASEAGRDYVPTEISSQTLWDTYLPPFEAGIKAGAQTVMSAFNNISGTPASANRYTMTTVLKEKWNHDGFIVSDWDAVRQLRNQGMAADDKDATALAFNAGLEMDMVDDLYRKHLPELIEEGRVSMEQVDESVRRVLRVKFRLGLFEKPYTDEKPASERILLPEYKQAVLEMARESIVLLKNDDNVLPVSTVSRVALIGPFADSAEDMLGNWAGRGRAEDVVTYFEGLRAVYPSLIYVPGCPVSGTANYTTEGQTSVFVQANKAAFTSDVTILCLGQKRSWSGENTSRSDIRIPDIQQSLLRSVSRAAHKGGHKLVVVLTNGRPLDLSDVEPYADAIVEAWHLGVMAGPALADVISGAESPSGRLTMTFPRSVGQIPIYYNRRSSGRRGTQGIYKDDMPITPLYEFGHGLSYATFEYSDITLDGLTATVTVKNTSSVDAKEVIQWYVQDPASVITRPVKELRHFEKRMIKAGESETFTFEIDPLRDLGFVDSFGHKYVDPGEYVLSVRGCEKSLKFTL